MLEIYFLKNSKELDTGSILEIINILPLSIKHKYSNISNIEYKRESLLAYLMLVRIINIKQNRLYLPSFESLKPYDKNIGFYFSISHTPNWIGIAVSDYDIGLDMEEDRVISQSFINRVNANGSVDAIKKWTYYEAKYKLDNSINFQSTINEYDESNSFYDDKRKLFISVVTKQ